MVIDELTAEECAKLLSKMGTEEFTQDFTALLKSRYPLIYIVNNEEQRLIRYLQYLSRSKGYRIYIWNCVDGLCDIGSGNVVNAVTEDIKDPDVVLDKIIEESENEEYNQNLRNAGINGSIYVLLDFHRFIDGAAPDTERRIKKITQTESMTQVIVTGPFYKATPTLEDLFAVLDFPLPNEIEIANTLYNIVDAVSSKLPTLRKKTKAREEELIKAASGLTLMDAQSAYSKSIVRHKTFDIPTILKEKKQIIRKKGILEYFDSHVTMDDVGGLDTMREWFVRRKLAFSSEAQKFGLKQPKGVLMIGTPGSGKSLSAKACASLFEMPLLRMDFGALFGSLVGESEGTTRDALKLAEAISPCCLWMDEVEKGLSGGSSSGSTDGGTTSRVIQTILTWMQEKEKPVFVVCTANDYERIPPEFMRAGRFDEVFFIDLPTPPERVDIFRVLIKRAKREPENFNLPELASESEGYSGAEIEKSIDEAISMVYQDSRGKKDIEQSDIISALKSFKPLSTIRSDYFEKIREWAQSNCRLANRSPEKKVKGSGKIDLDV